MVSLGPNWGDASQWHWPLGWWVSRESHTKRLFWISFYPSTIAGEAEINVPFGHFTKSIEFDLVKQGHDSPSDMLWACSSKQSEMKKNLEKPEGEHQRCQIYGEFWQNAVGQQPSPLVQLRHGLDDSGVYIFLIPSFCSFKFDQNTSVFFCSAVRQRTNQIMVGCSFTQLLDVFAYSKLWPFTDYKYLQNPIYRMYNPSYNQF